ncbi:MAG: zinc ABC transporter substrate-binding protein [Clostridia bacterium]|nr:zinc ABC transporter substrate-binding protein [Clostridia bacterium]
MKKIITIILIVFCLTGCANHSQEKDKITIVASNFPAYDFARQIAGNNANISLLLPPGAESHSFEPTPKDIITIQTSDLFICNGGESESWVNSLTETLDVENIVQMTAYSENLYTDKGYDEHVWCSPVNSIAISQAIYEELCIIDPDNINTYTENYSNYVKELTQLDLVFKNIINNSKTPTVVFADRFPAKYFTEEYNLNYFSAFPGCSEEAEPSAAVVASLIEKVRSEKIKGVFYIEFSNQKIADIICEETGCEKYLFHSCHNISKEEFNSGETYVSIMTKNAENLRKVLN